MKLAEAVAPCAAGYIASGPVHDVAEVESRARTHRMSRTLEKRLRKGVYSETAWAKLGAFGTMMRLVFAVTKFIILIDALHLMMPKNR